MTALKALLKLLVEVDIILTLVLLAMISLQLVVFLFSSVDWRQRELEELMREKETLLSFLGYK